MPICIPCQKEKNIFLFLKQNICCGYSNELSLNERYVKNNDEESIYNFTLKMFVYLNLWKCVEKVT